MGRTRNDLNPQMVDSQGIKRFMHSIWPTPKGKKMKKRHKNTNYIYYRNTTSYFTFPDVFHITRWLQGNVDEYSGNDM